MRKIKIILTAAILLSCIICMSAFAGSKAAVESKAQLNDKSMKVGVGEGSASMLIVEKELPNAEMVYLDGVSAYEAVAQGKLDAYVYERTQMQMAIDNGLKGVKLLDENMDESVHIAVGISPECEIEDFENRLNDYIALIQNDGTLDEMYDRWIVQNAETMPEIDMPDDPENHLVVGTTGIVPPYTYYKGTELYGLDIELAYRFAAWINADVEFKIYDYSGIIPACATGDIDCIMANLNVTPERAQALTFSNDLFDQKIGIMVRDDSSKDSGAFFKDVKSSFEKTFLREKRWSLFLKGILITIIITLLSIILGTALGFGIFMLCKDGNVAANKFAGIYSKLILGMPMVVLLMILYYIIFANFSISGLMVSIIGFTLTFGASVYGLLQLGVSAIDKGQYEAAYALGHNRNQTFFRIILPQALPLVMDSYMGEIIGLIKATAIVGYIAVQDLTKVGDIIRSRTYEAFFPLIAVAIIYYGLEWLFLFIVKKFQLKLNPKNKRSHKLMKGVVIHDQD